MDLSKNRIPSFVKKIHLIAVCGTGMGALACMLNDLGYDVTGSDQKVYPPMSRFLEQKGIRLSNGFCEGNIVYGPDLVVVGNAVTRDNPEARKVLEMGLYFCSMPQAINRFIAKDKQTILVTGTHGKTTTASIAAWILYHAGCDPSFFIGGILNNFESNYHLGKGDFMVVEGDEYDTAYFNKVPKFVHYDPALAVLTGVEFDHADIYRDMDHVVDVFDGFVKNLSTESTLFAYDGDETVAGLLDSGKCRMAPYGTGLKSPWRLGAVKVAPPWTHFEIFKQGDRFGRFKTKLFGQHNLLNALAAVAVSDSLKIPTDVISEALTAYDGVKRRQEVRGQRRGITVMDDFAHHPTAVRETVKAVKQFHTNGRLVAVFEPRTHASMRTIFQDIYPRSFDAADLICIRHPPMLQKIPADDRFSSEKLVDDLKHRGKNAHFFQDTEAIIEFLILEAKAGDILLIMSNGGFDNIHEKLLSAL